MHDVGVQADGRHGHDDEEFAQLLKRRGHGGRELEQGGDHRRQHKKQHKKRENLLQAHFTGPRRVLFLPGAHEGQHQCDGDDGQRPGKLDDGGRLQGVAVVDAVPGGRGGGDRGGVVDGGARKQAEPRVGQPQQPPSDGKIRAAAMLNRKMTDMDWAISSSSASMTGCGGRDGGAAADGGAHPDEGGAFARHLQQLFEQKGDDQRGGEWWTR